MATPRGCLRWRWCGRAAIVAMVPLLLFPATAAAARPAVGVGALGSAASGAGDAHAATGSAGGPRNATVFTSQVEARLMAEKGSLMAGDSAGVGGVAQALQAGAAKNDSVAGASAKASPPPQFVLANFLLFMEDCSGSTWAASMAHAILKAHGIAAYDGYSERIKDVYRHEVHWKRGSSMHATMAQIARVEKKLKDDVSQDRMQGKHYYSKFKRMDYDLARNAFHHTFLSPKALETTRVVNVWRRHPFERLVCLARDCIVHNSSLHMVDASGKWIDNCLDKGFNFDRHRAMVRKYGVKVYIDPAWAEAQARELVHLGDSQADFLRSIGFTDFETVATEDLDAFEYDSAHIDDSVDAWLAWMRSWGVDADATLVRRVVTMGWPKAGQGAGVWGHMNAAIGGGVGKRTRHSPFDSIANADAVMAALEASASDRVRALVAAERVQPGSGQGKDSGVPSSSV
mmetsp:Transcript_2789/g.11170  ORF Transcript_2789/g.11170 Transcript_2789/m.11170 type:complete len:458 (-) Transcript_2789:197-1570(-)